METLKHPACTVGLVGRLCRSWLSPGKATRIFHQRNSIGTIQWEREKEGIWYFVFQVSNLLSVEVYEPENNKWHHGEDFPDERKFTSVAQMGSSLYVCGGVRQMMRRSASVSRRLPTIESKDLYRYDLLSNTWNHVTRLVEHGSNVTCAAAMMNVRLLQECASSRT